MLHALPNRSARSSRPRSRGAAKSLTLSLFLFVAAAVTAGSTCAGAEVAQLGMTTGQSGLQLPRFVSLKASRVNVRVGPGEGYAIAWVFTRAGLPIEVIQEYDTWRRVRDSDGSVGWVFQSLLSGQRTAVVSPWASGDIRPLRSGPTSDAAVTAYLEAGVMGSVKRCHDGWCRIAGEGFAGWIEQNQLWGVYPDEDID